MATLKSSTPEKHPDGLDILICKILIWEQADKNKIETTVDEKKCLVLRECQDIEIVSSRKKLIGTATVKFPRGTVVKRSQPVTPDDTEKNGTDSVYTERLQDGTIIEKRSDSSVATPTDFKVGQRIRIFLAYYHDKGKIFKDEAERIEEYDKTFLTVPDFDGYIVKCSVSTPIEIKCENLASGLKRKNCRKITTGDHATVNDFLKTGGKYDLLKGTGLELADGTAKEKYDIGKLQLCEDLTVADVLTEWAKYSLYSFVRCDEKGIPKIYVGRAYTEYKDGGNSKPPVIQFDYHVANDGLSLMNTDPKYLAVAATGFKFEGSGKSRKEIKYNITVRLNPEWTGTADTTHKKFQLLNETQLSKKSMKLGAVVKSCVKDKVDLSQYQVVPYVASKIGITEDELIKEAEDYFENYHMNGIEGSLTIFGDVYNTKYGARHIEHGIKVELLDTRGPEKNGWYMVEEVTTTFGVNGFRQTLKLPYCYARPGEEEKKK